MQVAWQLGWVDVDEMLEAVSPQQFDEWVAFLSLEPAATAQSKHAHDWVMNAKMAAELINTIIAAVTAASGGKPSKENAVELDELLPPEYRSGKAPKKRVLSDRDGFKMLRRMTGL